MEILVHAPEDFNNLCVLARTLEVLGIGRCHVFDPHRIIRPAYGKSYTRKLKTVSAGAFFRIEFVPVSAPVEFIHSYRHRTIASVPDQTATSLYDFEFTRDDLLVLGSEAHGLPAEVIEACDVRLTIPQRGVTQSLNLCVASGIIVGEWFRQMGGKWADA
jgi:tRNA G18 (ribose-2'-O)-methylase SpoU